MDRFWCNHAAYEITPVNFHGREVQSFYGNELNFLGYEAINKRFMGKHRRYIKYSVCHVLDFPLQT